MSRLLWTFFTAGLLTGSFAACGNSSKSTPGAGDGAGGGAGGAALPVLPAGGAGGLGGAGNEYLVHGDGVCEPVGLCGSLECYTGKLVGDHVTECSSLSLTTNPPTSGAHYPVWAQFGIYDTAVPRGYWLHTIEHSAVGLLYNCSEAAKAGVNCEDLKAQLVAYYNAYPKDALCADVPHRLFITPDPNLDAPFAAVAWGYYLKGVCFDPDAVTAFAKKHYGMNYENLCASGIAPAACP